MALKGLPSGIYIDRVDMGVEDGNVVQPCKGCVGTAGGYHCRYPCDCYGPGSGSSDQDDLMHDQKVYDKLEKADGFVVFSPIHWYSVSTQVKAMFDRLVCASMSLTVEQSEELGIGKDAEVSRIYAKDGGFSHLLKNHLEGKYAGFFIHGDDGANDYVGRKLPRAFENHENHDARANKPKEAIAPLVAQCRYSGIFVPDDCIVGVHLNKELDYATANDRTKTNKRLFTAARNLIVRVAEYAS
jgi:multimeric flavodoxin WrbA